MPEFGVLAALLIGAGLTIGLYIQSVFSLGAWLTAVALLLFAFIGRSVALRESKRAQPVGTAQVIAGDGH